jgi:hypothetical protein
VSEPIGYCRSQVKQTETAADTISQKLEATTLRDDRYHHKTINHLIDHGHRFSELLEKVEPIQKMVPFFFSMIVLYSIAYNFQVEEQQNQRQILQLVKSALETTNQSSTSLSMISEQRNQIAVRFQNYRHQSRVCCKWCSCICHRCSQMRSMYIFGALITFSGLI